MPAASNAPQAVLDAWAALEVLSPQSYRRPEDLAGGDKQAVARLDQASGENQTDGTRLIFATKPARRLSGPQPEAQATYRMPREAGGEHSRKNYRLYYQIVLGRLRLEQTVKRILDVYVDKRVERPATRGSAAMAVVVVDQQGRPVEAPAAGLSSFGWGVPHALAGRLDQLAGWPAAETSLLKVLEQKVRCTDEDGNELPLTRTVLSEVYEWLVTTLGLPADLVEAPAFAIRSFQYFELPDPPDPLLLNSFFLDDLGKARDAFSAGRATPNLRRYLGVDRPASRKNLLHDTEALENAVAPVVTPPARWPGKGRHPLVLLQQAAVNSAIDTLRTDGILAVNGPPGTGKTTLLRDLVAAFAARAKAVENVSAELPGLDALAQDAGLRYFRAYPVSTQPRHTLI